jgi:membrane protein
LINFRALAANWYVTVIGFLFLVFVATTLFNVIRNSLDDIWQIKVESHPGFLFTIFTRTKSFIVILIAGILFLIALFTDGLDVYLHKSMKSLPETAGLIFEQAITQIISTLIFTSWFIILFRFLADGRPSWLAAISGGIVSGILFTAGKLFIKWALTNSNIGTLYGASGSIVLLLLFVFYSSFTLYYGAGFIKAFSDSMRKPIDPVNKAFRYQLKET